MNLGNLLLTTHYLALFTFNHPYFNYCTRIGYYLTLFSFNHLYMFGITKDHSLLLSGLKITINNINSVKYIISRILGLIWSQYAPFILISQNCNSNISLVVRETNFKFWIFLTRNGYWFCKLIMTGQNFKIWKIS